MSERRRNLWPLPGGANSYATNLRTLLKAVGNGTSRGHLESVVAEFAPTVRSVSTVRGYAAVPITLGLVERTTGHTLALTRAGQSYARSGDLSILRGALVSEVFGVEELLEELVQGPRTCPDLTQRLADRGIGWNHPMAVRYRVWWLVAAKAVDAKRDSRVDRLTLSREGRQLLAHQHA